MARKLTPKEALQSPDSIVEEGITPNQEFSIPSLGKRRDEILSMSPDLRAFFDKDAAQFSPEL